MDNTFVFMGIVLGAMGLIISLGSVINQLRRDVLRIEKKVDKISKEIGVSDIVTKDMEFELKNLIKEGKKIKAIKKYRMTTGVGLKEANDYIDLLSKEE